MKTLIQLFFLSVLIATTACNRASKTNAEASQRSISFADFKKIKGVENVQDVPFDLSSTLDSVRFFIAPHTDSAYLTIAYNKLHNYYGFEEFKDFYSIHYSIDNNIANSIEAFVLKSEFTAAFDLALAGANLYEIRSSTFKDSTDSNNKSFAKYGTIEEVTQQEFEAATKNRIGETLVKNPNIILRDYNWVDSESDNQFITVHESVSTVDGVLCNEYIGRSAFLELELFKEYNVDVSDQYYVFYNLKLESSLELFTSGYPQIIPAKQWVSSISTNYDVGTDWLVSRYEPHSKNQVNLLYVNFTQFKTGDEKKAFWVDNDIFYAEVYPTNSAPAKGKKQKTAYIKIQLKPHLFS